jgi:hypothetical protein
MKKLALCYDFDGTLCAGYMQNQKLIPDCKIDVRKFWTEVTKISKKNKIDPTLSYLLLLENEMHEAEIEISKKNFNHIWKET